MMTALYDPNIKAAGSLAGFNLGLVSKLSGEDELSRRMVIASFEGLIRPLRSMKPAKLLEEVEEHGENWDLLERSGDLSGKKIIMIGARDDELAWPNFH